MCFKLRSLNAILKKETAYHWDIGTFHFILRLA